MNTPGRSPWDKRPNPPGVEELLRDLQERFLKHLRWRHVWPALLIVLVAWLLTGVFVINPQEQGAVQTFGRLTRIVGPGPNFHWPYPIEKLTKERVTEVRRLEIGFRVVDPGPPARVRPVPNESLMLTGDESIVELQFTVQYQIADLAAYLFNVQSPTLTIRTAAEAAMREVIGKSDIDSVLTEGKGQVESETLALLSSILASYDIGVTVHKVKLQDVHPPEQVAEAFKAVASAREEKERLINEAGGYRNDLLPKAQGQAVQIVNQAEAYAAERVNIARGEAARFTALLAEYHKARRVTRDRLRIETMEKVLPKVRKVIIDGALGRNVVPLLPLDGRPLPGGEKP